MIERVLEVAVGYAWGWPLIVLLIGGGAYLTLLSRFLPFVKLRHAFDVLRGKYDDPDAPGEISQFRALMTSIAATVGVANIAGVAVAITQGGPGSLFWMWIAALVGMATRFFTCSLALMYRKEVDGVAQGGPMYTMEVALGPRWRPAAAFFSVCGVVGCLALFQANQLAEVLQENHSVRPWITGVVTAALVAVGILGGIRRITAWTARMVPIMCSVYVLAAGYVVLSRIEMVPRIFYLIVHDAFTGTAAAGGAAGIGVATVITTGVKRAAFSNEAGIGTAPLAHGATRTSEPIQGGLVAMLGPLIDTLLICSMTGFVILSSGRWQEPSGVRGVALTSEAFQGALGDLGAWVVTISIVFFAVSTMLGYSYYGRKCFAYLVGWRRAFLYDYVYVAALVLGAVWTADAVINLLDTSFAMMALPNMAATLVLAPRVVKAAREYFARQADR